MQKAVEETNPTTAAAADLNSSHDLCIICMGDYSETETKNDASAPLKNIVLTECGHKYHASCMFEDCYRRRAFKCLHCSQYLFQGQPRQHPQQPPHYHQHNPQPYIDRYGFIQSPELRQLIIHTVDTVLNPRDASAMNSETVDLYQKVTRRRRVESIRPLVNQITALHARMGQMYTDAEAQSNAIINHPALEVRNVDFIRVNLYGRLDRLRQFRDQMATRITRANEHLQQQIAAYADVEGRRVRRRGNNGAAVVAAGAEERA